MAEPLKFIYGTETQILALTSASVYWFEKAFYYPTDKDYFYQISNGIMKKYGGGDDAGVGARINGALIGSVKSKINSDETLEIPEDWEYNVFALNVDGVINCDGTINII